MQEIILEAEERQKKSGRFREEGYIPGILYGDGIENSSMVKFKEKELKKILSVHGPSANLTVNFQGVKRPGFIKQIQRKPLTAALIHIDVQVVSKGHKVKRQIPIVFKGEEFLTGKDLQLNIQKTEISVLGVLDLMPDIIEYDVSQTNDKDSITYKDFSLDAKLKIEEPDSVFATISELKYNLEDEETAESDTSSSESASASGE